MTSIIIDDNFAKSRLSVIKNCIGFCAFSRKLKGSLLQKQARELLNLLSDDGLFPDEGIGQRAADLDPSTHQVLHKGKRGLNYEK